MVCTGDVVDGVGCPDECVVLLRSEGIHTVRGNHDRWILEDKARHVPDAHHRSHLADSTLDYLSTLPTQVTLPTVDGDLLLCHGVGDDDLRKVWPGTERMAIERSAELDAIILDERYRYLVNGHMHFRTMMYFETMTLINAGTLRGAHWPGFSLVDFEAREIRAWVFSPDCSEPSLAKTTSLDATPDDEVWRTTQCFAGNWDPIRLGATST